MNFAALTYDGAFFPLNSGKNTKDIAQCIHFFVTQVGCQHIDSTMEAVSQRNTDWSQMEYRFIKYISNVIVTTDKRCITCSPPLRSSTSLLLSEKSHHGTGPRLDPRTYLVVGKPSLPTQLRHTPNCQCSVRGVQSEGYYCRDLFFGPFPSAQFYNLNKGGVTGHPETMCPRTNVLGPLVPQMDPHGNTMPLH